MSNFGESTSTRPRTRIDIAIEALILTGLILIPLIFRGRELVAFYSQPKYFVLHFTALSILGLWLYEIAMTAAADARGDASSWAERTEEWLGEARHRWTMVTVAGFGLTFVVSTLLSPLPWVSVWGRDIGDQGYDLYTTLSYLVIFFAVALRIRSQEQVFRIVLAIVLIGTLSAAYGLFQAFGWDPIGRGEGLTRVIASFGNPLFLGAYLVMSAPLILAAALHQDAKGRSWLFAPAALSIGLHFVTLWNAGGRGAWVAAIIGLLVFLILALVSLGRVPAIKSFGLTVGGGAIALIISAFPGGITDTGRGLEHLGDIVSELSDGLLYVVRGRDETTIIGSVSPIEPTASPPTDASATTPGPQQSAGEAALEFVARNPVGRADALTLSDAAQFEVFGDTNPNSQAIGTRADIWRGAVELAISRDRVVEESRWMRGVRFMFGFGPDMYFYSYPIRSKPLPSPVTTNHAHNYPLQVLLEQGLAGLIMFSTSAGLVLITAFSVTRSVARRGENDQWVSILIIGMISALIARAVEQGAGVGKVSDLVTFWAIMGLVIAIADIHLIPQPRTRQSARLSLSGLGARGLVPFAVVAVVGVFALVIFVQKDVNQLRAGVIAATGFEQKRGGDNDAAFLSFQEARALAPDVERYYTEVSQFLIRTATARASEDPGRARQLYQQAREVLSEYESRDPFAWQTQLGLASATAGLAGLGQNELTPEVVGRYQNISILMEPFATIQMIAGENIVIAGDYDLGETIALRAVSLEGSTVPLPAAWWALGEALFQQDRIEDAELAWETSIKRNGRGIYAARSQRGLAFINELRGNTDLATFHHYLADGLLAELR